MSSRLSCLLVGLYLSALPLPAVPAQDKAPWWPDEVERALARSGANRAELVKALRDTPAAQRKGMAFLIAHMPDRDLKSLRAAFLLENVQLAYRARAEVPWGPRIPEDIFLNDGQSSVVSNACSPFIEFERVPALPPGWGPKHPWLFEVPEQG